MNMRLKTSIDVETRLTELQSLLQLSSKAAVMRLAMAFSIKEHTDPRLVNGEIINYNIKNQNGSDYVRFTIFGDNELYYKVLMEQCLGRHITDDEFFPEMTCAHINRGINQLMSEVKLAGTKEKFLRKIIL